MPAMNEMMKPIRMTRRLKSSGGAIGTFANRISQTTNATRAETPVIRGLRRRRLSTGGGSLRSAMLQAYDAKGKPPLQSTHDEEYLQQCQASQRQEPAHVINILDHFASLQAHQSRVLGGKVKQCNSDKCDALVNAIFSSLA